MSNIEVVMVKPMISFDEYLYEICTNTDLKNQEAVTETMSTLAKFARQYHDMVMTMEDKLKELMSAKDFEKWTSEQAKKMFWAEIEESGDEDFIKWVRENFESITGEKPYEEVH